MEQLGFGAAEMMQPDVVLQAWPLLGAAVRRQLLQVAVVLWSIALLLMLGLEAEAEAEAGLLVLVLLLRTILVHWLHLVQDAAAVAAELPEFCFLIEAEAVPAAPGLVLVAVFAAVHDIWDPQGSGGAGCFGGHASA